jgi:hypothetical protein
MPKTAVAFTHLDETFAKGDEVADDHPLVEIAPHLFVQPRRKHEEIDGDAPRRIRGHVVDSKPTTKKAED